MCGPYDSELDCSDVLVQEVVKRQLHSNMQDFSKQVKTSVNVMERVRIKRESEKKKQYDRSVKVKKYEGGVQLSPITKQNRGQINSRVKLGLLGALKRRPIYRI